MFIASEISIPPARFGRAENQLAIFRSRLVPPVRTGNYRPRRTGYKHVTPIGVVAQASRHITHDGFFVAQSMLFQYNPHTTSRLAGICQPLSTSEVKLLAVVKSFISSEKVRKN
jgi:hypothetical protein